MDPYFRRALFPPLHPQLETEIKRALSQEPWTWPLGGTPAFAAALRLVPSGPPSLRPGQAPLLVARTSGAADLFLFELVRTDRRGAHRVHFEDGLVAWTNALRALPSALPFLWRAVTDLPASPPPALRVANANDPLPLQLEHDSFGLSFVLSLASHILAQALPSAVAASAVVGPNGLLGRVESLEAKIEIVVREAPGIRRLVVAACQEQEARGFAQGRLEILAFNSAAEAVEELLRVTPKFTHQAQSPDSRGRLARSLFQLALSERHLSVGWAPVAAACDALLEHATDAAERGRLAFCRAVARRHEGAAGSEIPLPTSEELAALPGPARVRYLSHLTQQAADFGNPDPQAMLELATRELAQAGEGLFPDHLRLVGSLGRLHATLGEHERALARQLEAAQGWQDVPWDLGISYPLSEAFRLVTACERCDLLDPLEELRGESLARGLLRVSEDMAYIEIHRGAALLALGDADQRVTGHELLAEIWTGCRGRFPGVMAGRWLHRHRLTAPEAASQLRDALRAHTDRFRVALDGSVSDGARAFQQSQITHAARALALCELDHALHAEDDDAAREAVASLRLHAAQQVAVLERHGLRGGSLPGFLARHFPY